MSLFVGVIIAVSLCAAPSGSSLSLASAATEADSVTSGGGSQRLVWMLAISKYCEEEKEKYVIVCDSDVGKKHT